MLEETEGFVLHRSVHGERSAWLCAFTERHGKLRLWTRRARNRLGMQPGLRPFCLLWIKLYLKKGGLCTLVEFEERSSPDPSLFTSPLQGFYLNELLIATLEEGISYPGLYALYRKALLDPVSPTARLSEIRRFEHAVLDQLGYRLPFPDPILEDVQYLFHPNIGFSPSSQREGAPDSYIHAAGQDLRALLDGQFGTPRQRALAQQLFWAQLTWHLPLKPFTTLKLARAWRTALLEGPSRLLSKPKNSPSL